MSGFDTARLTVERLLAEAKDGDTLEKAANAALALTKASQAELDGRKVENEIIKLKNDVALGRRQARAESTRHYVSVFGPLATTFVLAGTLALQTYTAILSDQAKLEELDRQRQDLQRLRDAEEDTRWAEMLKTLSQEYKELSPGLLNLRRFFSSPRYADQARVTAEQTLSQTANVDRFNVIGSAPTDSARSGVIGGGYRGAPIGRRERRGWVYPYSNPCIARTGRLWVRVC